MKRVHLPRHTSLFAALLVWALLSLLAVFIIWGYRDRARLIRDTENERILNTLFAALRDYDSFGAAIEDSEILRERITGFAVYAPDTSLLYRWGSAPDRFDLSLLDGEAPRRFNRYTIPDRRSRAVRFVIRNEKPPPRAAGQGSPGESFPRDPGRGNNHHDEGSLQGAQQGSQQGAQRSRQPWFFSAFSGGNYMYIDISHSAYWNTVTFTGFLYPVSIIALLILALSIRVLSLRNIEYRERIEAQQNLVVLGTAASTLAHEIKNPLHSIKLQTGILKKIAAGTAASGMGASGTGATVPVDIAAAGAEEIARIEEEVDRLAALTYRVNDYLRDPAGSPEPLYPAESIEECSRRLCGRSILALDANRDLRIRMDGERARSVFENIIRNALEAGGPEEAISAGIKKEGGKVIITISDRGKGMPPEDMQRAFDPFYTSKSAGTGIGLAVSRRFVEAAGGTIVLEHRADAGSGRGTGPGITVRILLPGMPNVQEGVPSGRECREDDSIRRGAACTCVPSGRECKENDSIRRGAACT
ncbi:MAG: HAMP domain-containing histidine kinase [Treponema sp.]|jgi:two-component system sensor histidine kinase HydH|nr:HAMP domain-containing histidine kinase [Treponema sp.]